jgi:tripartite-type tricarboxylate transporter receptor subunit TctC
MQRSTSLFRLSIASVLILAATASQAQTLEKFPAKPLSITVPYPPGGGVDLLARLISTPLSVAFDQPVVVENRAGAGGTIGARYVVTRPKDGYSLLMMNDAYAIAPGAYKSIPYDSKKDLAAVINVAYAPMVLVASSGSPYKSLADVVAAGSAKNSKLAYGSCGTGTAPHLAGELLNITFKMNNVHIPYKGCGPAIVDVIGGQIELAVVTLAGALPYINSGKFKALAITSKDRSPVLPNVPSVAESGGKGFNMSQWQGLAVPAGTSEEVKATIHDAVSKIMKTEAMQKKLLELGYTPADDKPAAFQKIINNDIDRFTQLAKQIGLTLD